MKCFPGYKLEDVLEMNFKEFSLLREGMVILNARETFTSLLVSDYPHLKKQSRERTYKRLYKAGYPPELDNTPVFETNAALSELMARHGK